MSESLCDQIIRQLSSASELYHRLLVVVAPAGSGKTVALQDVHAQTGAPLLNINLALSTDMLDLTERQRTLQLPRLLNEIVGGVDGDTLLLDNIEILFDAALQQDPLRLLQNISRNKTLVVAWNGSIENGFMTYATPDHHEFKKYPVHDLLIACPEGNEC